MKTIKDLINNLGIDEQFTTQPKKQKQFNKIKKNLPLIKGYNYQADILMMPTDKKGNHYLLCCVDLADDSFDIQEMKFKDPLSTLEAYLLMLKRNFIKIPFASMRTDNGGEFLGVFHSFLLENNVFHKFALPDRHTQLSNIESLNGQLGRIFNGYMNKKELETNKAYREWTDIINYTRTNLNKIRTKQLTDKYINSINETNDYINMTYPKYNIGDLVYKKLETPRNALNEKVHGNIFRKGDFVFSRKPEQIKQVLIMQDYPFNRYILNKSNVSYSENQLLDASKQL
jgi:hypothetical protein